MSIRLVLADDHPIVLHQHGLGLAWPFIERAAVTSAEGRAVLELDLRVGRR